MTVYFNNKIEFIQTFDKMKLEAFSELDKKVKELKNKKLSSGRASREIMGFIRESYDSFKQRVRQEFPDESYKNLVNIAIIDADMSFFGPELKLRLMKTVTGQNTRARYL